MKNKIFNVEFLGMPGSGKSYIQNIILKKLKLKNYLNYYSDYKLLNRICKIFFFFRFLLSYPIFSLKTLMLIKLSKQQANEKNKHMYYFVNEASLYSYFISLNKNIFLINSEGFLYRTSFYFNQNKSNLKLKHYLRNVPKVDMVILIKNKKKDNIYRANSRINEYKYNSHDIKNYGKKNKLIDRISKIYKSNNKCKFLKINNYQKKIGKTELDKIIKTIKK